MDPEIIEAAIGELRTVGDMLRWGVSNCLKENLEFYHGTDNAWDEVLYLIYHTLNLPYDYQHDMSNARLLDSERKAIAQVFSRRINERIPAAYLTKEAWFAGLPFYVDERVVIPRSPVAELIERQFTPWVEPARVQRIADLCTGSACIAIACAHYFPDVPVDAIDISPQAVEVANMNVAKHGLEEKVRVECANLFEGLMGERYDIIISNPPYVDETEMRHLTPEHQHEPMLGLAGGLDGLDVVDVILAKSYEYLTKQGIIVVEVGQSKKSLIERHPKVPFTWVDFEYGGEGIFILTADQLVAYRDEFLPHISE